MEITKTEYQIMQIIWSDAPCNSNHIITRLNEHELWHDKTAKTLIGRLVKKDAITFIKEGRQYIYSPLLAKDDYQLKESKSFVQRIFGGRVSPLVASFAQKNKLTQTDINELKGIIDSWEKAND